MALEESEERVVDESAVLFSERENRATFCEYIFETKRFKLADPVVVEVE